MLYRRAGVVVLAIAAVSAFGTPAATAQAPAGDSVTGGLIHDGFSSLSSVSIDARSGPNGEAATGDVRWHSGGPEGPTTFGTVTCLSVERNRAIIGFSGGYFFQAATFPAAGLVRVVDGGGPNSRLDTFEFAYDISAEGPGTPGPGPLPGPTDCSSYPPPWSSLPLTFRSQGNLSDATAGDLVVTDARPIPTAKDQCKHGGWKNFPGFKNQGDCVSFVATGGKNPPASP